MDRIDFRSDTVSWPTDEMRAAMAAARVGDDVYGEDPTVNELEATAAEMLGKEAGLFVASGTMGNLVAILTHAGRGDEAIVGANAHTYRHEAGGMAVLGGIMPHPLPTDEIGRMSLVELAGAIRPDDPHYPNSRLILLENSYGSQNGAPIPPDYFAAVRDFADANRLVVHLDGARFFNAAVALNIPPATLARDVDSLSVCLSKGLCAPVGSVLCGPANFIARARRNRKLVGGGMRQAGVLAAAGLVALRQMVDRLAEDHRRAGRLAAGLRRIPGLTVDPPDICTNIIYFRLDPLVNGTVAEICRRLQAESGIWLNDSGSRRFRAVTHYWIDDAAVDLLLKALAGVMHAFR